MDTLEKKKQVEIRGKILGNRSMNTPEKKKQVEIRGKILEN